MTDPASRDASTDRLLRRTLGSTPVPPATDVCLDAETAAAWIDGRLDDKALEIARTHAADCARCQQLLATIVRTEGAPLAAVESVPRHWWRWLVPLAAVATLIVVALVIPRRGAPRALAPAATAAATRPLSEVQSRLEPAPLPTATPSAARERDARNSDAVRSNPAQAANNPAAPANRPAAGSPSAVVAAAPPPPAAPAAAPKPVEEVAQRRALDRAAAARAKSEDVASVGNPEFAAADSSVRWRLSGTAVEKSVDGGRTWTSTPTGLDAVWTAGAAPSADVCWIVGRAGAVARSTDGRTWQRLPFPEATDLSAIRATDASTAIVTSGDGSIFETTDGGLTWVRRLVQAFPTAPFNR